MRKPKAEQMRAFDIELGKRLERARTSLDVKAKDLARAAGVTANAVYSYECGRCSCPPGVLSAFAAHLGVSVAVLIPKPTSCSFPEN